MVRIEVSFLVAGKASDKEGRTKQHTNGTDTEKERSFHPPNRIDQQKPADNNVNIRQSSPFPAPRGEGKSNYIIWIVCSSEIDAQKKSHAQGEEPVDPPMMVKPHKVSSGG